MMNVLLSAGHGDLHFVDAAKAFRDAGCSVTLIQNWSPSPVMGRLFCFLGVLLGKPHLIRKRVVTEQGISVLTCRGSRILLTLCSFLRMCGLLSGSQSKRCGWVAYGWLSRRLIKQYAFAHRKEEWFFFVRSGAGQGGAIRLAKALGARVIVDHSLAHPAFMEEVLGSSWGPDDPFWQLVMKDCHEADIALVNSEFVKETFMATGYPREKIRVAYLGVSAVAGNKELPISKRVELLFTGVFGRRKGADLLLEMMSNLRMRGVDSHLQVVGDCDAEFRQPLETGIKEGYISYQSYMPKQQLAIYLESAEIYVFPSRAEGCACSGMEAMSAGLCVVATRESGLPITHGIDGYLVPSGNASALTDQVEWLISHPAERCQAGERARQKVNASYTWEQYAKNVMGILAYE
jgi:glycosyltransferase involved in cell wall biosynthesis